MEALKSRGIRSQAQPQKKHKHMMEARVKGLSDTVQVCYKTEPPCDAGVSSVRGSSFCCLSFLVAGSIKRIAIWGCIAGTRQEVLGVMMQFSEEPFFDVGARDQGMASAI